MARLREFRGVSTPHPEAKCKAETKLSHCLNPLRKCVGRKESMLVLLSCK